MQEAGSVGRLFAEPSDKAVRRSADPHVTSVLIVVCAVYLWRMFQPRPGTLRRPVKGVASRNVIHKAGARVSSQYATRMF